MKLTVLKEDFSEIKSLLIGISTDLNSVSTETHWAKELNHEQERKINFLANQARELVKKAIKITEE